MPPMRKVKKDWQTGLIGVGKGCYGYIQTGGLNISNAGLVVGTGSVEKYFFPNRKTNGPIRYP